MSNYTFGRIVEHDHRSRAFKFNTAGISVHSVHHVRKIPVLDQGNIGSCTGNATVGCVGTLPFYTTLSKAQRSALNEAEAVRLYSQATRVDEWPGEYPPDDTGTSGLAIAKAAVAAGYINGYRHTFSFDDALKALSVQPVISGINWYEGFTYPDAKGVISQFGQLAGGHEIVLDEIDLDRKLIGATNSWGTAWGLNGRFYIPFELFEQLLHEDGDVTVFTPLSQPAPEPVYDQIDSDFAAVLHEWLDKNPWFYKRVQRAADRWLSAKEL